MGPAGESTCLKSKLAPEMKPSSVFIAGAALVLADFGPGFGFETTVLLGTLARGLTTPTGGLIT